MGGTNGAVAASGWGSAVPNQDNANQKSEADLDRQIIDLGHAIALNPKNASAYRDRALLNVRKRDFTHALNDLDQAIFLNSKDAIAYYYRGYIQGVRKENTKAIEDFGKAIELDPARGEFYRAQREKLLKEGASQNQPQTNIDPNSSQVGSNESTQKGLAGFCKRLAQYYAEFLSTDFKKQRLPRRRLQTADAQGRLVGIPLRKYAGFQQEMWERLGRSIGTGLSFSVPRGVWRSALTTASKGSIFSTTPMNAPRNALPRVGSITAARSRAQIS